MLVVMDIDGTCADIRERLAIAGEEPNRNNATEFQLWLDRVQNHETLAQDKAIKGMLQVAKGVAAHATTFIYVTGRSEKYRTVTHEWLYKNYFPLGPLFMRRDDDWRTAAEYKESVINHALEIFEHDHAVVIDDDGGGDCESMYRRNGWTMLKVIV